jgi:hypothetical protein
MPTFWASPGEFVRGYANLARLGIRGFRPMLAHASERLMTLRTPEDATMLPNTLAELQRDMALLHFVKRQIKEIEAARRERLASAPGEKRNTMVLLLARVVGIGVETADMLVQEVFSRKVRDRKALARYAGNNATHLFALSASTTARNSPKGALITRNLATCSTRSMSLRSANSSATGKFVARLTADSSDDQA